MSIKTSFSNLCAVLKEKLGNKVDKVEGKGLSTNDFTTAYKTKLDGIAAEANKITVDSALSGTSTNPVQNKVVAERIGTIEANVSAAATTAGNAAAAAAAVKKDLANYYKKTETYSQAEINNKISVIPKFDIKVCEVLPDSNISKTTVYLLKSSKEETNNLYDEYIYVKSKWELLGSQTIDLSGYVTTDELTTVLSDKVDKVPNKGLSTNDFTTAEKTKLKGLTNYDDTAVKSNVALNLSSIGMSKKNLLKLSANTQKINGITFTVNDDKSVTVTGTASDSTKQTIFIIANSSTLKKTIKSGKYILSGCPSGGGSSTYRIFAYHINPSENIADDGNGVTGDFDYSNTTDSNIAVIIAKGHTDNINLTFYPMLRYADITDGTYAPYQDDLQTQINNIMAGVNGNPWITTDNLKYRKSGYIVALQGSVTPSDSTMSITLGTLPENCRPSQDINIAQASTDTPSRQIIVQKGGSVVLLFSSNCTASHTYAYNGIFMI